MTTDMGKSRRRLFLFVLCLVALIPSRVFSQAPFYQGKTITVIVSTSPAGTGDLRVKTLMPFLRKHIAGNPTLVLEYMDGGGGRKAANHMFRGARPDGLTIGAMGSSVISLNIMGESGVMYDIDKFIYLGAPESVGHQTIYTRKELGLSNLEKLRAKPGLRIGAQSVGHVSYIAGRFFAFMLDFKEPKFIAGYTAPEVDAALLRGELDARANAAVSVLRRNSDWLDKGVMDFHTIMEIPKGVKHARLDHLPKIDIFVKTEREKKLLEIWRVFRQVGSPYILPPGTPKDKVDILQESTRRALSDGEFHREFLKLVGDEVEPLSSEELTKIIKSAPRDADVAGRLFAYFLDLKDPKFVVGYTAPEVDVALMNGEVDARANSAISVLRRNPEWLDKKVMNFHAIMEIPKGIKHPRLSHLPEIESFAKTEREKKLLAVWRAFRGVGSPYILPPGTPKDRVEILEEAMRRIFKDPEFAKYFRKLVDDDPSPLSAAELARVIKEMPRDAEVQELLRKLSGAGPLPPR